MDALVGIEIKSIDDTFEPRSTKDLLSYAVQAFLQIAADDWNYVLLWNFRLLYQDQRARTVDGRKHPAQSKGRHPASKERNEKMPVASACSDPILMKVRPLRRGFGLLL
jgi:hypothetical protein